MIKFTSLVVLFLSLLNCSSGAEKLVSQPTNNQWNKDDAKELVFTVDDYKKPKNIIFVVENNDDYKYNNLFLISTIKDGKEIISSDTMNYILAQPNGKWLGEGFGEKKEIKLLYKDQIKFSKNGSYSVHVKHGMRTTDLSGIENIGMLIEDVK